MGDLPAFLRRLELDRDADEKAVRRAYARCLKAIDQEHDLDGFQQLRDAYERALEWVRERPSPLAPPAGAPQYGHATVPVRAVLPGDVPVRPPRQGDAAAAEFATFTATFAALAQRETLALDDVVNALREALASERLVNLAERAAFEQHIAQLLAGGWQRGHEVLFPAACDVFAWREDGYRLQAFGRAGALLHRAIDERHMFDSQSPDVIVSQRWLVASLRREALPSEGEMQRFRARLDELTQYFPVWLAVVAPAAQIERWRHHYAQARKSSFEHPTVEVKKAKAGTNKWVFWMCVMGLLAALRNMSEDSAPKGFYPPSVSEAVPVDAGGLPHDVRARIVEGIDYTRKGPRTGTATYYVTLGTQGEIVTLGQIESSSDPAFDEAVKQSIRAQQPFPSSVRRTFEISVKLDSFGAPASGK